MENGCSYQNHISGLGSHKKYRRSGYPKLKATQDSKKGIAFKLSSPISGGGNLKINREQEVTLHESQGQDNIYEDYEEESLDRRNGR